MQQRHRTQAPAWRRLALAICLLALSVLAPTIWRELPSFRGLGPDSMLAAMVRDADRCLGMAKPQHSPELDESGRLDVPAGRPLDLLADFSDDAREPLAGRKAALTGRVGRWFVGVSPSAAGDGPDQEAFPDVLSTPAPTVQEEVLLAWQNETVAPGRSRWAVPTQLIKELKELAATADCRDWAMLTATIAELLAAVESPHEVQLVLEQLRAQLAVAGTLPGRLKNVALASRVRRIQHALERRLDVWEGVLAVQRQEASKVSIPYHLQRLAETLTKADEFALSTSNGDNWRKFLLLAELRDLSRREPAPAPEETAALIRRAVARMQARGLMARQRRYLRSPALVELKAELQRVIDDPVDTVHLLTMLEAYESDGQPSAAEEISDALGRLARSLRPEDQRLAEQIERHYRGPNLRVSLSQRLVARVLPDQGQPQVRAVNDTIMGVPGR